MRLAHWMALCALLILVGCNNKNLNTITAPSEKSVFTKTLTVKATATAYASCNNGSSRAWASAYAEAEATVTGTGSTQEAANADAQAKYDATYAEKQKDALAKATAAAVAICETGGTPIPAPPGPPPTPPTPPAPKPQCDDGIDNDGDGKIDYPADPGCSSKTDDDEKDATSPPPSPPPVAPLCSLSANPTSVPQGTSSTLIWSFGGGTVRLDKSWTDNTSLNGSSQVVIDSTRTFTVTCYNSAGQSSTATATVAVTGPLCPTVNDYTPAGGALAVGQSKTLTATDLRCDPFWGVDSPSRGSLVGSDKVVVIDGKQYPVGQHAVVKRIAPGTFNGFIQPTLVNTNKTWHAWTDATGLVPFEQGEPARAAIMFDVRADGSVWYNGKPVEQTGPPRQ